MRIRQRKFKRIYHFFLIGTIICNLMPISTLADNIKETDNEIVISDNSVIDPYIREDEEVIPENDTDYFNASDNSDTEKYDLYQFDEDISIETLSSQTDVIASINSYVNSLNGSFPYNYYDSNGVYKCCQCCSFVNHVWKNVFGIDYYMKGKRTTIDKNWSSTSALISFLNSNARPGDAIWAKSNHNMVLMGWDASGLVISDGKSSGAVWHNNKKINFTSNEWKNYYSKYFSSGYRLYHINDDAYNVTGWGGVDPTPTPAPVVVVNYPNPTVGVINITYDALRYPQYSSNIGVGAGLSTANLTIASNSGVTKNYTINVSNGKVSGELPLSDFTGEGLEHIYTITISVTDAQGRTASNSVVYDRTLSVYINAKTVNLKVGESFKFEGKAKTDSIINSEKWEAIKYAEPGVTITEDGYCTALLPGEWLVDYDVNVTSGNTTEIRMITCKVIVTMDSPTIKTSSYDEGCVKLTINPVSNADGYRIEHSVGENHDVIDQDVSCSLENGNELEVYNIKFGTINHYKVYAYKIVNGKEVRSTVSNESSIFVERRPQLNNFNVVKNNDGQYKLTWDKNKYADSYIVHIFRKSLDVPNAIIWGDEGIGEFKIGNVSEYSITAYESDYEVFIGVCPSRDTWSELDDSLEYFDSYWKYYCTPLKYEDDMIPVYFNCEDGLIRQKYHKGEKIIKYDPQKKVSNGKYFKGWHLDSKTPGAGMLWTLPDLGIEYDMGWDFDNDVIEEELFFSPIYSKYPYSDEEIKTMEKTKESHISYITNPEHICDKETGEENDYSIHSSIYFGAYPQSEVTDKETKEKIDDALNSEGKTKGDVWVDGIKYRKIDENDVLNSKYFTSDTPFRYYRWERIKWRVLKISGKNALLVSDKAIDTVRFNEEAESVTWKDSTVRSWLNGYNQTENAVGLDYSNSNFLQDAFSDKEIEKIKERNIEDDEYSYDYDVSKYTTKVIGTVSDKVSILSRNELLNEEWGFCSNLYNKSSSRWMTGSAYALSRGCISYSAANLKDNVPNVWYWTRTSMRGHESKYVIDNYGDEIFGAPSLDEVRIGLVPCITIDLSDEGVWDMVDDGTSGDGGDEKPQYAIKYNLNGGTNSAANPSAYYLGDANIKLSNPSRDGYNFKGWYKDSVLSNAITEVDTSVRGGTSVYAKWEEIKQQNPSWGSDTEKPDDPTEPTPAGGKSSTETGRQTGTGTETQTETQTGTQTETQTGTQTETQTGTQTRKREHKRKRKREHKRKHKREHKRKYKHKQKQKHKR